MEREMGISYEILLPLEARVLFFSKLFSDLRELGRISKLCEKLVSEHGAKYLEIADGGDTQIRMDSMRPPQLVLAGKKVVANDVNMGIGNNVAILTGANGNGKSVYAISMAQNIVMAQAGLPIFARNATLVPRTNILSKFGDYEGNIEDGESRHTADCLAIANLLHKIGERDYVYLDEMGTGTDPEDSEVTLGRVFDLLKINIGSVFVSSTHYKDFARGLLEKHPEVNALAFEFDSRNRRTFRATPGIATTSGGDIVAQRKGLSQKDLDKIAKKWEENGYTT
jgi:DNA mismatch repair protein MutS2